MKSPGPPFPRRTQHTEKRHTAATIDAIPTRPRGRRGQLRRGCTTIYGGVVAVERTESLGDTSTNVGGSHCERQASTVGGLNRGHPRQFPGEPFPDSAIEEELSAMLIADLVAVCPATLKIDYMDAIFGYFYPIRPTTQWQI
jgi:hypothetical protein